jgi:hypothetical protein
MSYVGLFPGTVAMFWDLKGHINQFLRDEIYEKGILKKKFKTFIENG